MKTGNIIIKITVIIGTVLSMLVGGAKSSGEGGLYKLNNINYKYIMPCTIVSEPEELALENYTEEEMQYVFIKNLLINKDDARDCKSNSENTEDIIVIEDGIDSLNFSSYYIYTCFYREVEENGIKKKKYIPYKEATEEDKKILIFSTLMDDKFMAQLEEARNRMENTEENTKTKQAIKLVKRITNRMVCQFYIDNAFSSIDIPRIKFKYMLEDMKMTDTTAYALFSRETKLNMHNNHIKLFRIFKSKLYDVNQVLDKNASYTIITDNNQQRTKDIFTEDTNRIATQIMDRKQNYGEKTVDELRNDSIKDIMMFINILTDGKAENHAYIGKEKLKKEKEKEGENRPIEAVDRCQLSSNSEMCDTIGNSKNSGYNTAEDEEKNPELDTEVEIKAAEMFSQMIGNTSIEVNLDLEGLIKEIMAWNSNLLKLLHSILTKYNEFEGTAEKLMAEITAANAQIANELLNNRKKLYKYFRNIFIIRKTIENELAQIMNILEKKQDVNGLQNKINKEEIELIIDILESILNESNTVTKEEQIIRETLEYISLGEDNPEEEQRIEKLLHKMVRKEYIPEEQDKPQNKQEKDIRTILSEIKNEFMKLESFEVTDKSIQMKKQEIVDIITVDKDIFKMANILTEIVEIIVDILVDGVVDHTQYRGFKAVEEEIKKEEEYIRSQNLKNMLDSVFGFVDKYICLNLNSSIYLKNGCEFGGPIDYISQMKNFISSVYEKTASFILYNISKLKVNGYLYLFWLLTKTDSNIDTLKTYDEFWLNPAFLHYYSKQDHLLNGHKPSYVEYRHMMNSMRLNKNIKPTDRNLKIFRKARSVHDMKELDMAC